MRQEKARIGLEVSVLLLGMGVAGLPGCASDGSAGHRPTYMQACLANAKTEQERSQCAWNNSARMADGGR